MIGFGSEPAILIVEIKCFKLDIRLMLHWIREPINGSGVLVIRFPLTSMQIFVLNTESIFIALECILVTWKKGEG